MNRYDLALFFVHFGTGPRAGRGGGYTPIIHKTAIGDGALKNRDAIPDAVPVLVLLDKKDDMAYLGSKSNSCLE